MELEPEPLPPAGTQRLILVSLEEFKALAHAFNKFEASIISGRLSTKNL